MDGADDEYGKPNHNVWEAETQYNAVAQRKNSEDVLARKGLPLYTLGLLEFGICG